MALLRKYRPPIDKLELQYIMRSWPTLIRQTTDPRVMDFAQNVWNRSFNPNWRPTVKQSQWIRELHREISEQEEEISLIED